MAITPTRVSTRPLSERASQRWTSSTGKALLPSASGTRFSPLRVWAQSPLSL